jgi:hypothetical protein
MLFSTQHAIAPANGPRDVEDHAVTFDSRNL